MKNSLTYLIGISLNHQIAFSNIQSEVSQKNKHHVLTHMYGIQENYTDEPICRKKNRGTDIENGIMNTAWKGEGGTD